MGLRVQHTSLVLLVAIAVHGVCYGDSRDLTLVARPVFEGIGGAQLGAFPFLIEVANRGEDTRGEVILRSTSLITRYPLELPRGAKKQFFAYQPGYSSYDELWIELDTTQGGTRFPVKAPEDTYGEYICLIGGSSGDMTFLRTDEGTGYEARFRDVYGKPGSLPDRPAGYSAFSVVALGEGAERMTNQEVDALKSWVVAGGTLVFFGGASAPILQDARWQSFLPVRDIVRLNVSSLPRIESIAGSTPPPGLISIAVGKPVEGSVVKFAAERRDLISERRIGLGHVVYVAFDPFQAPLKQWQGLRKLFRNGFGATRAVDTRNWLIERNMRRQPGYYPTADAIDSPFDISLPPTGTVLLILFAHLLVSVPLNIYVMRRLGKGDLAWITTPLISVAFAAVFFNLASGLYEAGQSVRTRGVLIVSHAHPTAIFRGVSELFIPRGGSYDLGMRGVDLVQDAWGSEYYYYSEREEPIEVVDDGSVNIPNLRTTNLAFKEFAISQSLPGDNLVRLSAKRVGDNRLRIEIDNLSPYVFDHATVHIGGKSFMVGQIDRGGRFDKVVAGNSYTQDQWSGEKTLVLKATMTGFRPGPQIGDDVGSSIELVYFGGVLK